MDLEDIFPGLGEIGKQYSKTHRMVSDALSKIEDDKTINVTISIENVNKEHHDDINAEICNFLTALKLRIERQAILYLSSK